MKTLVGARKDVERQKFRNDAGTEKIGNNFSKFYTNSGTVDFMQSPPPFDTFFSKKRERT